MKKKKKKENQKSLKTWLNIKNTPNINEKDYKDCKIKERINNMEKYSWRDRYL